MIVHLEVYVTDPVSNTIQAVWRRTIYDFPVSPNGMTFLLRSTDRAQKWMFPSQGVSQGEHYDTNLDAYVIWVQMTQNAGFEVFGFTPLHPERWT